MKLLITGATGFIGSHIINLAHQKKISVVAVKRRPKSQPRIKLDLNPEWICKPLDQLSISDFKDVDVILHLASHTPNIPYAPLDECIDYNVVKPLKMFNLAYAAGITKFISIGTCFEYGKSGLRYEKIPVDAPLEPTNSYAASKACASIALSQWALHSNVALITLRLFQVYGEGELETRLWPMIKRFATTGRDLDMTNGSQLRDFSNVVDIARKIICYAEFINSNATNSVSVFNLGSGQVTSVRDFADYWWKHWGASGKINYGAINYRENEVMTYLPDLTNSIF